MERTEEKFIHKISRDVIFLESFKVEDIANSILEECEKYFNKKIFNKSYKEKLIKAFQSYVDETYKEKECRFYGSILNNIFSHFKLGFQIGLIYLKMRQKLIITSIIKNFKYYETDVTAENLEEKLEEKIKSAFSLFIYNSYQDGDILHDMDIVINRLLKNLGDKIDYTKKQLNDFVYNWFNFASDNNSIYTNCLYINTEVIFTTPKSKLFFDLLCKDLITANKLLVMFSNYMDKTETGIHNIIENFPKFDSKKCTKEELKDFYEWVKEIRIYSRENFLSLLSLKNYKKIRYAKNLDERLMEINRHQIAKVKKAENSIKSAGTCEMLFDFANTETKNFSFTKNPDLAYQLGDLTNCCYKKDGAAESLVSVSVECEIAGNLIKLTEKNKWFSFIWEKIRRDERKSLYWEIDPFYKELILDNVECSGIINLPRWNSILEELKEKVLPHYGRILIGQERNDIQDFIKLYNNGDFQENSQKIPYYQNSWRQYGYDDSHYTYEILRNRNIKRDEEVRYAIGDTVGEFHRFSYYLLDVINNYGEWYNNIYRINKSYITNFKNDKLRFISASTNTRYLGFAFGIVSKEYFYLLDFVFCKSDHYQNKEKYKKDYLGFLEFTKNWLNEIQKENLELRYYKRILEFRNNGFKEFRDNAYYSFKISEEKDEEITLQEVLSCKDYDMLFPDKISLE